MVPRHHTNFWGDYISGSREIWQKQDLGVEMWVGKYVKRDQNRPKFNSEQAASLKYPTAMLFYCSSTHLAYAQQVW